MKWMWLILFVTFALALACTEDREGPLAPIMVPEADIDDGAHAGNEHFYFLPPMVDAPTYSGAFDGTLQPMVTICVWKLTEEECGPSLEMYSMNAGPGSETVRMVAEDEHYIVNWHTDDILENFPLGDGEVYRIRVLIGSGELGHADVVVAENRRELKNVDTEEFIPLLDGRTLPIKFRIEEGALEDGAGEIVSAGYFHTCAVDAGGVAHCWGRNAYGQLGDGTFTDKASPVTVLGGHTFQSVTAGAWHSCGLTTDGKAYCWGNNSYGALGKGDCSGWPNTPVAVTGGHTFESLKAGWWYTCGIRTDGAAFCWGNNHGGQIGTGGFAHCVRQPFAVIGGHTFQSVDAHFLHTCGLTTDGSGFCWGSNPYGQVGDGTSWNFRTSPTPVTGEHTFQSISVGHWHSCGVTTGGEAHCWGNNWYGQLGDGTNNGSANPTAVVGDLTFRQVNGGHFHTCGLASDGDAYCWGLNDHGQLGDNTTTGRAIPATVFGGHTFQSVSAGAYHSCGATTANDAFCWGWNDHGQLGDDTHIDRWEPVFVLGLDPPTP